MITPFTPPGLKRRSPAKTRAAVRPEEAVEESRRTWAAVGLFVGPPPGVTGLFEVLCASIVFVQAAVGQYSVTTLAGSTPGFADGQSSQGKFSSVITGLDVDSADNIFVADAGNLRIRKISSSGAVTTLAGTGVAGTNDGPALEAQFSSLAARHNSLCVDTLGNCFVLDPDDNLARIRKVTSDGLVTTIHAQNRSLQGIPGFLGAYPDFTSIVTMDLGRIAFDSLTGFGSSLDEILILDPDGAATPLPVFRTWAFWDLREGQLHGLSAGHSSRLFCREDDLSGIGFTQNSSLIAFSPDLGGYSATVFATNENTLLDALGFVVLPNGNAFLVGTGGIDSLRTNGLRATVFSGNGLNGLIAVDGQQNLYAVQGARVIKLLVQPTGPVISEVPADTNVAIGDPVSFTVAAEGESPLRVQWQFNSTNIAGATNWVLTLAHAQLADVGTYTAVVSNAIDNASASATLQVRFRSDIRFQSLKVGPSAPVSFVIDGPPGTAFELHSSSELPLWGSVQTFQNPSGHLEFTTDFAAGTNSTFFRAKALTGP